jgi:crotonobetainyl-CoA:carnitine CoA-transferase CaiB-like acyl-CoA transferase
MISASTALSDITVIDLTTMIAGPTMGRLFAELGANVIHVEPPHGDDGRNSTTPFLGAEGTIYSVCNRSKRGIVVDIRQPAGREVLLSLVRTADVFVENMTPGRLDQRGLGYADLHALNPRLVYVSISGWGQSGPLAQLPGYDVLVQALVGAMRSPHEGAPPNFSPVMVGDPWAPVLAAFATMVVLRQREQTGKGAHVTTSLLQSALHGLGTGLVRAEDDTVPPEADRPVGLPGGSGAFASADGLYSVICAWTDDQFQRLSRLAGYDHLADDPAYASRLKRQQAQVELNELFATWTASRSRPELLEILNAERIPCSPVTAATAELLTDADLIDNGMVVALDHPTKGRLWQAGPAFAIDGTRGSVRPAPLLGQHTDDVLRDHGYSDAQISELRASGAIA